MATPALARFGSHELKKAYLEPALRGEMVCSIAVSEPDAGSDVAGIRTRAVRDGDDWVINGRKMWITNGTQADWLCLLARTSDEGGYAGMSMIVVPTDTPGFSVGRKIDKMGNRSSDTAELVLDDVRVPVSNTIGEIGRGFQQQMAQFQDERMIGAYMAVAGARRAIDRTIDYLRVREAFGKPLLANQHLQYRLAELVADIDVLTSTATPRPTGSSRARTSRGWRRSPSSRPAASCARSPTSPCSTTAAWATPRTCGSSATSATRASCRSAAAPTRSCCGCSACSKGWASDDRHATRSTAGVATITLAARRRATCSPRTSMRALVEHLAAAANDDAVRVVVLTGEGNTFCAGADLSGASSADADSFAARARARSSPCSRRCCCHPKPIVARVQGHVAGGGNGLVAAADLAVAAESAKFAFSEVRVGVAPAVISVVCLARMTPSHARELLLTGERVTRAARARGAGSSRPWPTTTRSTPWSRSYVDQLLLGGPEALARTKELLRRVPGDAADEAFAWTAELSACPVLAATRPARA